MVVRRDWTYMRSRMAVYILERILDYLAFGISRTKYLRLPLLEEDSDGPRSDRRGRGSSSAPLPTAGSAATPPMTTT
jgi:hypothetical protein